MKKLTPLLLACAFAFAPLAHADDAKPMGKQQGKMVSCNKDATGKKGDERKAFMKDCLKKDAPAPAADAPAAPATPQARMKSCNKDATGKKGDERKAFMKDCLKAK